MNGLGRLARRAFSLPRASWESPLNDKNTRFFISRRGFVSSSASSSPSFSGTQFDRSRLVSPSPFGKCGLLGGQRRGLKSLCRFKGKSAGRNSSGRITIFHRGGGAKRLQRIIDLKRSTSSMGIIERVEYDPNRSSRIALVRWTKGVHLPHQRSNTVEKFASQRKIFDPTTTTIRGIFSFSSLPGIREVEQSKKTFAKDVFFSAFSSKPKGDTPPLSFPRIAVAGANPAFLAPRIKEKLKGEDSSPCEVQKWRPHNSILWKHRNKRKAALSWQSSRQQKTLGFATHRTTAAAKHAATH
ncbi:uncharacterized protein LOC21401302 [Morus notabilis]|nr:uncharacterized protein LOC21401302 [Morus notabilis]XP_024029472.1 uncharacterized protein LOC21401302 [Morus notabilis]XP_024029474.1 uncharacterized protein LOC21401302 [Morus notabilis]